ncbi:hypothetical protein CAPTEDRAFT_223528 [Capitella teleta]|uniref:IPT/TIG domain-containing protein n=1 Tax=Capitella teleta TaxID=283909 RepID=R7TTS7_CAPTE|nr:hypothetical protein CAPTEDRAFT_223528 [Capitella teleta]|eukprot:ELT97293.1 hypothetical protein CAPTEDRAFT_223528 [Capitella teleta]
MDYRSYADILRVVMLILAGLQLTASQEMCSSGSEWVNGACELCQVGFYRTNGIHGSSCLRCPNEEDITRYRGAMTEKECNMSIGSRNECPSGQEWLSSRESCVTCERGTYRSFGVDYWCVICPDGLGTESPGASSREECKDICKAGTIFSNRKCILCDVGTFRPQSSPSTECTACPLSFTTLLPGSISENNCYPSMLNENGFNLESCPSGTEPNNAIEGCSVCLTGYYRKSGVQPDCTRCPDGMTTLYPGATNYDLCRTESGTHTAQVIIGDTNDITCPLGTEYHVTLEGLKGCRPCPRGTYRDSKSASYCWQCSNRQSTPLAGAARGSLCGSNAAPDEGDFFESENCPQGTEWRAEHLMCTECDYGFYKAADFPPDANCSACTPGTSTASTGSTSERDCSFNIRDTGESRAPFAFPDQCPSGTEWSLSTCVPCPIGYYRQQATGQVLCVPCPKGLWGRSLGWRAYCFAIKWKEVRLTEVQIQRISPPNTTRSGHTVLSIQLSAGSEVKRIHSVKAGNADCILVDASLAEDAIRCTIGPSHTEGASDVTVVLEDGRILVSSAALTFLPDPIITSISRMKTFASGGVSLLVTGEHFHNVQSHAMTITNMKDGSVADAVKVTCTAFSDTQLVCVTPNVTSWFGGERRTKRSAEDDPLTGHVTGHVGFVMGGVRAYRYIADTLPEIGNLAIYTDPVVDTFVHMQVHYEVTNITLQGSHLDGGTLMEDFVISVNSTLCALSDLQASELTCNLSPPFIESLHLNHSYPVQLTIGPLVYEPGSIMFINSTATSTAQPETTPTSTTETVTEGSILRVKPSGDDTDDDDLVGILVPTFIAIAILIILVVLFVIFYSYKKRKLQKHDESLRVQGSDTTSSSTNSLYYRPPSSSTDQLGCLPPLPIDSVFGHDRITDHGVSMRSLALPSDSMPQQVENSKRMALCPTDPTFIYEPTIPLTPEQPHRA